MPLQQQLLLQLLLPWHTAEMSPRRCELEGQVRCSHASFWQVLKHKQCRREGRVTLTPSRRHHVDRMPGNARRFNFTAGTHPNFVAFGDPAGKDGVDMPLSVDPQ